MTLTPEMEEVLQALYTLEEDGEESTPEQVLTRARVGEEALESAFRAGLVISHGGHLRLTERGRAAATLVVRRHRLAERLLHDVLQVSDRATEEAACKFEHALADEVTESICTLLGHPRFCPHGRPIPPGPCCSAHRRQIQPVVEPLSELPVGASGVVAYIHTNNPRRLDRLASFGLLPGTVLHLHQTWPSLVISLGETHLALDRETAQDIYVRRLGPETGVPTSGAGPPQPGGPSGRRWCWRWRRGPRRRF